MNGATHMPPTPVPRSYWILPGRLLGGALPSDPTADARRDRIERLLDAGVHTIVNLMEEEERDHWGRPFTPYEPDFHAMAALGGLLARTWRHPIRDGMTPTPEEMRAILDTLDAALDDPPEGVVMVHCWGGVGRTATVAGCWLLRHGHATPETVLDTLTALRRRDVIAGHRTAPETSAQRRFLLAWPERPDAR